MIKPIGTWWPSEYDQQIAVKMNEQAGHFRNCRYYQTTGDRTFVCSKTATDKTTCAGCMTCPNCGGRMYTSSIVEAPHKKQTYITHGRSCIHCGAYAEMEYVVAAETSEASGRGNSCQVEGCNHTAYEGLTTRAIHAEAEAFIICLTHHRRIKTWRLNTEKGEERVPVMVISGKLFDNPDYETKQKKRKK